MKKVRSFSFFYITFEYVSKAYVYKVYYKLYSRQKLVRGKFYDKSTLMEHIFMFSPFSPWHGFVCVAYARVRAVSKIESGRTNGIFYVNSKMVILRSKADGMILIPDRFIGTVL